MKSSKIVQVFSAKPTLIILILLFKATLDVTYVYVVSPYMSWTPPRYPLMPNSTKVLESYLLTLILALCLPSGVKRPSDFLITLLFLNPILPTFSLYGLADRARGYTYMIAVAFMLILLTQRKMPKVRISTLREGPILALGLSILGVIGTLAFFISQGGLQYFDLGYLTGASIAHLYALRETLNEAIFQGAGPLSYLPFWTYYVFMSTLLLLAIYKRRYGIVFVLLALQLVFMGLSGRRGVLGAIPILLGTYLIIKRRYSLSLMTSGFMVMVAGSTLLALAGGIWLPSSLISERSFFTPARLNYAYYEFFSEAGFVYLSSTSLAIPIDYPFELIPTRLVGQNIFLSDTVASEGFLGTSYMHFGFWGMAISAIIVGILLKLADSIIIGRAPMRIGVPLVTITFTSLFTSSDLTTALMTYGILPAMFLLWLLGRRTVQKVEVRSKAGRHLIKRISRLKRL